MSSEKRIEPRTLKGFRDYLPAAMIPRERLIDTARRVYRSYGYSPIDTPALEYLEILLGKGSAETDKQLYQFQDHGQRLVGLRFDLTVPFARFMAQHFHELGTPFKRYHIGTVWRGENTQAGRYREFMQCDFDTIGTTSPAADIETALVIHDLLRAIGVEDFSIRVNNRLVLTGLLERLGLAENSAVVLRSLDKLGKVGPEKVAEELIAVAGLTAAQAGEVLRLASLSGSNDEILRGLEPLMAGSDKGGRGLASLAELLAGTRAAGIHPGRLRLDVAIARGLDYYTGTVFETFLDALPRIGSVCSGGRYDDLASLYTSERLPGIGASLGLDRLLAALEELGLVEPVATPAQVLVAYFDPARLHDYLTLAAQIRRATYVSQEGAAWPINVELYPEPRKLGQQLKYADRRGFRAALIAGEREFAERTCQVKDLATGGSVTASLDNYAAAVIQAVQQILATPAPAGTAPPRPVSKTS